MTNDPWQSIFLSAAPPILVALFLSVCGLILRGIQRESKIKGLDEKITGLEKELEAVDELRQKVHDLKRDCEHDFGSVKRHQETLRLEVVALEKDLKGDLRVILDRMGHLGDDFTQLSGQVIRLATLQEVKLAKETK